MGGSVDGVEPELEDDFGEEGAIIDSDSGENPASF